MNDRIPLDNLTSDQLDALYEQLDKAEQETTATATAAAHMTSLILDRAERAEARLAHLQATSEAAGRLLARESDRASRAEQRLLDMTLNRDQLQAALNRVRALAADLERGAWTGPAIARRIRTALDQP